MNKFSKLLSIQLATCCLCLQACSVNKTIKVTEVVNDNIVDASDISEIVIENESKVHNTSVYKKFSSDDVEFKTIVDSINESDWTKSEISYTDLKSLKGYYLAALNYSTSGQKYIVYMNPVRMEDIDATPFEDMLSPDEVEENNQDTVESSSSESDSIDQTSQTAQDTDGEKVVAYLFDANSREIYETSRQNVQNALLSLGDQYSEARFLAQLKFQTSSEYNGTKAYTEYQRGWEDTQTIDSIYEYESLLADYLELYFANRQPNLVDKLNVYEDLSVFEYKAKLVAYDQYGYELYAMYYLNDNTVRQFNYSNGNSWIDGQQDTVGNMEQAMQLFSVYSS